MSIKLSIIVPCFNSELTIATTLDSILMQEVNFNYEIIAIDDKSIDNTQNILKQYMQKYHQIKMIKHETNQGNAGSFYDGIKKAQGEYFCVLDSDDYYTLKDKLQRQVDFLDKTENNKYVAVAHHFLIQYSDGTMSMPTSAKNDESEFAFLQFLIDAPYYHTSCYMYRNIFKNENIEFFKQEILRGDTPRTFFALFLSNKKVKILNFFGSVYNISGKGIYQHLSAKNKVEREIRLWETFKEFLNTSFEKQIITKKINNLKNLSVNISTNLQSSNKLSGKSKDNLLKDLSNSAFNFAFKQKEYMFNGFYKSEYLDSLCATIGYCGLINKGWSPIEKPAKNKNNILIIISSLNPKAGGIFSEICEIISMYQGKNIFIICTDIDTLSQSSLNKLANKYVHIIYSKNMNLSQLFDTILSIQAHKTYYYCGHTSTIIQALIQPNISKNIHILSYDHGFVLSLTNPNFDTIIVKRPVDYWLLKNVYKNKIIYIPCWNKQKYHQNQYLPFNRHSTIITASGAARYYKLSSSFLSYIDTILASLKVTGGKHIHYGPMPENVINKITKFINDNHLPQDVFINIPWEEDLQKSLIENHIDLFIEPFPIVSYKMTLNALAAGIPILAYKGNTRLSLLDFIYQDNMTFSDRDDYINKLLHMSKETLKKHSRLSFEYFVKNHSVQQLKVLFLNEKELCIPQHKQITDDYIKDISEIWYTINKLSDIIKSNKELIKEQPKPEIYSIKKSISKRNKLKYKIWKHLNKNVKDPKQYKKKHPFFYKVWKHLDKKINL